jgi:hypothetical protein
MEETISIVFTILVGDRPYLHEGQKLSNWKDIQTIWFHQLIVFVLQQYFYLLSFVTMSIIIQRNSMSHKYI